MRIFSLVPKVFLACLIIANCTTNSKTQSSNGKAERYTLTTLPTDITQTWVSDPASLLSSEHVMILLQGGPRDYLYFEKDGRTLSRYLPNYATSHAVYLHQAQTLNPNVYARGYSMTIGEAQAEIAITTAMLANAIRHFKSQGKKVSVVGHSYGAFVIIDYLSSYEPIADSYIVSAGRIDVNLELVADNLEGLTSYFEDDALTYTPFTGKDFGAYSRKERGEYHVRGLLKAAYGQPRYSSRLAEVDLSQVYFVSGKNDQSVGRLTEAEAGFLKRQGATVLFVEGGHYDVYKRMIDAVTEGRIALVTSYRSR